MLGKREEARQILAANWRLNAPPHANTTPRIAFLRHLTALLESQPDTPFLGQLKTLLTGPELPVASDVAVPFDIRADLTMLIGARCAEGESVIQNIGQTDRGFERMDEHLRKLGAKIESVG